MSYQSGTRQCTAAQSAGIQILVSRPNLAEQAALSTIRGDVLTHTEDVGTRFAEEARRAHYSGQDARSIRGQTRTRGAVEWLEEDIDVMLLPVSAAAKDALQKSDIRKCRVSWIQFLTELSMQTQKPVVVGEVVTHALHGQIFSRRKPRHGCSAFKRIGQPSLIGQTDKSVVE